MWSIRVARGDRRRTGRSCFRCFRWSSTGIGAGGYMESAAGSGGENGACCAAASGRNIIMTTFAWLVTGLLRRVGEASSQDGPQMLDLLTRCRCSWNGRALDDAVADRYR